MESAGSLIKDGVEYLAFWFIGLDEKQMDIMGAIWREPGGTVRTAYRHHYYDTGEQEWFGPDVIDAPDLVRELKHKKGLWEYAALQFGGELDWNENVGSKEALLKLVETKAWGPRH